MDYHFREYSDAEKRAMEASANPDGRMIFFKFIRTIEGPLVLAFDYMGDRVFVLAFTPALGPRWVVRLTKDAHYTLAFLRPENSADFQSNIEDGDDLALADSHSALHVTFTDRGNRAVKYITVLHDGTSGFSIEPVGSVLRRTSDGMVFLQRPGRGPSGRATFSR